MPNSATFIGQFRHSIDVKNRLMVPLVYRQTVEKAEGEVRFFVVRGLDKCLAMYTASSWQRMLTMLDERRAGEFTEEQSRLFRRHFFASAAEVIPDKAGRVLIPDNLRGLAGLKKQVILNGSGDRIEIWDADEWLRYSPMKEGQFEQAARQVFQGG